MRLVRAPWRGLSLQLLVVRRDVPEALFYLSCPTQYLSLCTYICAHAPVTLAFAILVPYWQLSLFKCACAPPTKKNYLRYTRPPSLRPARRACQPQERWAVLALRTGPKAVASSGSGTLAPGSPLSRSRAQRGPSSCLYCTDRTVCLIADNCCDRLARSTASILRKPIAHAFGTHWKTTS